MAATETYIVTFVFADGPKIGNQHICGDFKRAVEIATDVAMENLGEPDDDNREDVSLELTESYSYISPDAEWAVCIGSPEN